MIALFLAVSLLPGDFDRLAQALDARHGPARPLIARLATVPAPAATGVRTAIDLVRDRDRRCSGAVAWWGFDIAVLWACFHAFGALAADGVIIMAYFVGMLGNTLPLPGGIGGVDGGMIGAFTAFGVGFRSRRRRRAGLPGVLVLAADASGCGRLPAAAPDRPALAEERRGCRTPAGCSAAHRDGVVM